MERSALSSLAALLERLGIRWVLIGALAANRYRRSPRLTQDVDLLLDHGGADPGELEQMLRSEGWRVKRASPEGDLLRLRHPERGLADLLIAGTDYQRLALDRARAEAIDADTVVRVLTPEDVIVHKLIADRHRDLADIEAILAADLELDEPYIEEWCRFWGVEGSWERLKVGARD